MGCCFGSKQNKKPPLDPKKREGGISNTDTNLLSPGSQTSEATIKPNPGPITKPNPGPTIEPNPGPITKPNPGPTIEPNPGPITNPKPEPIPNVNLTEPPPIILPAEPYNRDETVHLAVSNLLGTLAIPIQTTASTPCKEFYALVRAHARKISTKQFLLGYKGRILYDCEKTLGEWGVSKDGEIDCYFQP